MGQRMYSVEGQIFIHELTHAWQITYTSFLLFLMQLAETTAMGFRPRQGCAESSMPAMPTLQNSRIGFGCYKTSKGVHKLRIRFGRPGTGCPVAVSKTTLTTSDEVG